MTFGKGTRSRDKASLELDEQYARRVLVAALTVSLISIISYRAGLDSSELLLRSPAAPVIHALAEVRSRLHFAFSKGGDPREKLAPTVQSSYALIENRELREELVELRAAAGLSASEFADPVIASVLARPVAQNDFTFTIDRGARAGIKEGSAVVYPHGTGLILVGMVIEAGVTSSRVRSILDSSSRISVRAGEDGVYILKGRSGGRHATLELVSKNERVAVGEEIYTSKESTLFPGGLLVGTVKMVRPGKGFHQEIEVSPARHPESLDYVGVLGSR